MLEKNMKLEDLVESMGFIKSLYDLARIVDPIKNQVLTYQKNVLLPLPSKCYDVWEKNQICENCISMKTLKQDESYAKIEYLNHHVYMVLAIPIHLKEEKVVLELMRDISEERILFDSPDHSKSQPYSLLKNRSTNNIKDGLTKIFNNRYIHERLPYDILNSHLKEKYLSIIMIDIDNFKKVNKEYGNICGNNLLIKFAQMLEEKTRESNGWVARYTADTFIAVLENYSPKKAKKWAENLREEIEDHDFICQGVEALSITASIGVYTKEKVDVPMEEFISRAKAFLEKAKDQGKNSVLSNENADLK